MYFIVIFFEKKIRGKNDNIITFGKGWKGCVLKGQVSNFEQLLFLLQYFQKTSVSGKGIFSPKREYLNLIIINKSYSVEAKL